jgi:hypothetical protein
LIDTRQILATLLVQAWVALLRVPASARWSSRSGHRYRPSPTRLFFAQLNKRLRLRKGCRLGDGDPGRAQQRTGEVAGSLGAGDLHGAAVLKLARTGAEAHLYMAQQPCGCGRRGFADGLQSAVIEVGNDLASRYTGR